VYVDALNGFGSNFFGYAPPFIARALHARIDEGFDVGPQTPLAGEAAALVCELTGMDRAAFCNTGSEAVTGALRIARTVTGRSLVVAFSGSYHGIFDEVLVRDTKTLRSVPAAPGIMPESVQNILVLEYGTDASLAVMRERAGEIAAVLVEPVQSRRPDFQPREFLHALRALTREAGAALIFDEVITGFRAHPGGAQAHFGVEADLAAYGKVVGGGMPIGVVAGRDPWMDALDGGVWQFGDDSVPTAGVTYFAGTFVRHPLAMQAAVEALRFMKAEGPALQERVNAATSRMAAELNAFFASAGVPLEVRHFASLWKTSYTEPQPYGELLFCHLRDRGVHIWDGFPCFLTMEHGEAEVRFIVDGVQGRRARAAGRGLPPRRRRGAAGARRGRAAGARRAPRARPARDARLVRAEPRRARQVPATRLTRARGRAPRPRPAARLHPSVRPVSQQLTAVEFDPFAEPAVLRTAPSTESQRELWTASALGPDASAAFNEAVTVRLRGALDRPALGRALAALVGAHEALHTVFSGDGTALLVEAPGAELPYEELAELGAAERDARVAALRRAQVTEPFDLARGPLWRARLAALGPDDHLLFFSAHHAVCDGWSLAVILADLADLYTRALAGGAPAAPARPRFSDYAAAERAPAAAEDRRRAERYWVERFAGELPVADLPADRPRPPAKTYASDRVDHVLDPALVSAVKALGARHGASFLVTLLSAFGALVQRLTGAEDVVVGIPAAGQSFAGAPELVGHCVNMLPVRATYGAAAPFTEVLAGVRRAMLDAHDHHQLTFGALLKRLAVPRDPSRLPWCSCRSTSTRRSPASGCGSAGCGRRWRPPRGRSRTSTCS
jgi:glutamate-1-semialdehyde aminotransferase